MCIAAIVPSLALVAAAGSILGQARRRADLEAVLAEFVALEEDLGSDPWAWTARMDAARARARRLLGRG